MIKSRLNFKKEFQSNQLHKYQNGLLKLEQTSKVVDELKSNMDIVRFELAKKKQESEETCFKIKDEKIKSEKEKQAIEEREALLIMEKESILKLAAEA